MEGPPRPFSLLMIVALWNFLVYCMKVHSLHLMIDQICLLFCWPYPLELKCLFFKIISIDRFQAFEGPLVELLSILIIIFFFKANITISQDVSDESSNQSPFNFFVEFCDDLLIHVLWAKSISRTHAGLMIWSDRWCKNFLY